MSAYSLALALYDMAIHGEDGTVPAGDEKGLPTHGYFVGGLFPSLVFDGAGEVDRGELAWWIGNNDAEFYGVWVDTETGKIYFDGVSHFYSELVSVTIARARGEIAIWDIHNKAEIRLKETPEGV
jgi:hypothetical protein